MDHSHPSEASPRAAIIKSQDSITKPSSPYLEKQLQARRGYSKHNRARRSDIGPQTNDGYDDDIFLAEAHIPSRATPVEIPRRSSRQSTPVSSNNERSVASPERQPKTLGTRELDKYIDKLSKLNFDLKMELHHCRERMGKLEEQCKRLTERAEVADEVADKAEQDRKTLLEINDEMIRELEKRDEAVSEAVDIICQLEDKVEMLEQQSAMRQAEKEAHAADHMLSTEFTADGSAVLSRLPRGNTRRRVPSFMLDKKSTNTALRSVYLEPASKLHAVKSHNSLRSQRDELPEVDDMDSPHLSVLSESSFPSIYNPKRDLGSDDGEDDAHQFPEQTPTRHLHDVGRTKEWIVRTKPLPSQHQQHNRVASTEYRYQSLDDRIMHLDLNTASEENISTPRAVTKITEDAQEDQLGRPRNDSPVAKMYASKELPPTPESASTRLLGQSRSSLSSSVGVPKQVDKAASVTEKRDQMTYPEYTSRFSSSEERIDDEPNGQGIDKWTSTGQRKELDDSHTIGDATGAGAPPRLRIRHVGPLPTDLPLTGENTEVVQRPRDLKRVDSSRSRNQVTIPWTTIPRSETSAALAPLRHHKPLPRSETTPTLLQPFAGNAAFEPSNHGQGLYPGRPSMDRHRLSDFLGIQRSPSRHRSVAPPTSGGGGGVRRALSNATHKVFGSRNKSVSRHSSRRPVTAQSEGGAVDAGAMMTATLREEWSKGTRPVSQDATEMGFAIMDERGRAESASTGGRALRRTGGSRR